MPTQSNTVKKLTWLELVVLFGIPTALNAIACKVSIPFFQNYSNLPIEISYFLSVGILVLMPMFFAGYFLSKKETPSGNFRQVLARMRIKKLTRSDWAWTVLGFLGLVLSSYLIAKVLMPKFGMDATPFFFQNMPLDSQHMYIVWIWPLFFFFNIFGEEFYWRGYIQTRQEKLNGRVTWLVHGTLWAFWHSPMGWDLIVASAPIFFILPAIVMIRKNTSIAIIIHTVFGAFGFLAISFGGVH